MIDPPLDWHTYAYGMAIAACVLCVWDIVFGDGQLAAAELVLCILLWPLVLVFVAVMIAYVIGAQALELFKTKE